MKVAGAGPQNQVRVVWWAATGRSVRVQTRLNAASANVAAAAGAPAGWALGAAFTPRPGRLAASISPATSAG